GRALVGAIAEIDRALLGGGSGDEEVGVEASARDRSDLAAEPLTVEVVCRRRAQLRDDERDAELLAESDLLRHQLVLVAYEVRLGLTQRRDPGEQPPRQVAAV